MNNIESIKSKIIPVLEKYPVLKAGLFGSVTRGEDNAMSDIDVLIEFARNHKLDLLDFIGIKQELEETLEKKVDLVQYKTIKPHYRKYILPFEVRIYEKG